MALARNEFLYRYSESPEEWFTSMCNHLNSLEMQLREAESISKTTSDIETTKTVTLSAQRDKYIQGKIREASNRHLAGLTSIVTDWPTMAFCTRAWAYYYHYRYTEMFLMRNLTKIAGTWGAVSGPAFQTGEFAD